MLSLKKKLINHLTTFGSSHGYSSVLQFRTLEANRPIQEIFPLCRDALFSIKKYKIKNENQERGGLYGKVGMSWTSFGELVKVSVQPNGSNKTLIEITSKPMFPATIADYGKNLKNVNSFVDFLNQQIGNDLLIQRSTASKSRINTAKDEIMKGQILDFSVQKNEGLISAADGGRYTFSGSEWKGDIQPYRGMSVDFETKENNAIGVFRALGQASSTQRGNKSKAAATLWGAFLGGFGAHKFYMGSWGWGLVYLLTCWLYIPFIVALVEWVRYVLMSDDEFYGKVADLQNQNPGPFSFFW